MRASHPPIPKRLPAGDGPKIIALAKAYGLQGLRQKDLAGVFPPDFQGLTDLAKALESEGRIRILSFAPLHLVAREAIDYFEEKFVAYLEKFHSSHIKERGVALSKIQERFEIPRQILLLCLKTLVHEGKLREDHGFYALADFVRELPEREERVLQKIEEECFAGHPRSVSPAEVCDRMKLSPETRDQLLDILVERKRIIAGKDGYYVHRPWLEDLVEKLRAKGPRDLPVAEFKEMTGLSRKYAIPLLELLDEMGVTRRKGAGREILDEPLPPPSRS
ncbi:MAG TPA: SelB C-terminal domain-containing protein [Candidatus Aminicenantes bacterium]|nr:SelB C-terminal domain-containing protein [Candidatus Aminicenantes bacterium]